MNEKVFLRAKERRTVKRARHVAGTVCVVFGLFTVFAAFGTMDYYEARLFEAGPQKAGEDPFWTMFVVALLGIGLMIFGLRFCEVKLFFSSGKK